MKNGDVRPKGKKLDFALAVLTAIRQEHDMRWPMSLREIADMTQLICKEAGFSYGGCTSQNISRIEMIALRKVRQRLGEAGWNYVNAK